MKNLPFILGCISLLILAGCFGKNKFQREVEKETLAVNLARETYKGAYDLVTASELKTLIDSGTDLLVVDTMPYEASFKKQHVPGAVNLVFPIPDMLDWDASLTADKTVEDYKKLLGDDLDRPIVIYCGFVKCTRSHNGAAWAVRLGYRNVKRFTGGIFAWKGAGYPTQADQ